MCLACDVLYVCKSEKKEKRQNKQDFQFKYHRRHCHLWDDYSLSKKVKDTAGAKAEHLNLHRGEVLILSCQVFYWKRENDMSLCRDSE